MKGNRRTRGKLKEARGKLKEQRGKLESIFWKVMFSGKLPSQEHINFFIKILSKECKKQSRKGGSPQDPKNQPTLHNNLT